MKKTLLLVLVLLFAGAAFAGVNNLNPEVLKKKISECNKLKERINKKSENPLLTLKSTGAVTSLDSIIYNNGEKKIFKYNSNKLLSEAKYLKPNFSTGGLDLAELHNISYNASGKQTLYSIDIDDAKGGLMPGRKEETTYDSQGRLTSEIISLYENYEFNLSSKTTIEYDGLTITTFDYAYDPESEGNWKLVGKSIAVFNDQNQILYDDVWAEDEETGEFVYTYRYFYKNYKQGVATLMTAEMQNQETGEWEEQMRVESELNSNGNVIQEMTYLNFFGNVLPMLQNTFTFNEYNQLLSTEYSSLSFDTGEMNLIIRTEYKYTGKIINSVSVFYPDEETGEAKEFERWELTIESDSKSKEIAIPYNFFENSTTNDFCSSEVFDFGRLKKVSYLVNDYESNTMISAYSSDYYYSDNSTGPIDPNSAVSFNNSNFSVGPNPVVNNLYVNTKASGTYEASVYNVSGKILSKTSFSGNTTISLDFVENGILFFEIKDNKGIIFRSKLLKN